MTGEIITGKKRIPSKKGRMSEYTSGTVESEIVDGSTGRNLPVKEIITTTSHPPHTSFYDDLLNVKKPKKDE